MLDMQNASRSTDRLASKLVDIEKNRDFRLASRDRQYVNDGDQIECDFEMSKVLAEIFYGDGDGWVERLAALKTPCRSFRYCGSDPKTFMGHLIGANVSVDKLRRFIETVPGAGWCVPWNAVKPSHYDCTHYDPADPIFRLLVEKRALSFGSGDMRHIMATRRRLVARNGRETKPDPKLDLIHTRLALLKEHKYLRIFNEGEANTFLREYIVEDEACGQNAFKPDNLEYVLQMIETTCDLERPNRIWRKNEYKMVSLLDEYKKKRVDVGVARYEILNSFNAWCKATRGVANLITMTGLPESIERMICNTLFLVKT